MAKLCLWTKIRTKQWLVLGASTFQHMRASFLCPKCDCFACRLHWKCQLASTPEPIELCMALYQGLYAKFVSMMFPKCSIFENDGKLMLTALHTVSATVVIFSGVHTVFRSSRFGLSMTMTEPNATILLVYITAKIKMSFTWKDDFLPKSASPVSRSRPT